LKVFSGDGVSCVSIILAPYRMAVVYAPFLFTPTGQLTVIGNLVSCWPLYKCVHIM
jgi:hypothetical protein